MRAYLLDLLLALLIGAGALLGFRARKRVMVEGGEAYGDVPHVPNTHRAENFK